MESMVMILLHFFVFFFLVQSLGSNLCAPEACNATAGPAIVFPFRLSGGGSSERCGYPGFELNCNSRNQTILQLPQSGEFVVSEIDYASQAIYLEDPNSCLPARLFDFSVDDSPFQEPDMIDYSFFNCSSSPNYTNFSSPYFTPVWCLIGKNYTVFAGYQGDFPANCMLLATIPIPLQWELVLDFWLGFGADLNIELSWQEPSCGQCVSQGGVCGYKSNSGLDVDCQGLHGGNGAVVLGVVLSQVFVFIGLACCIACSVRRSRLRRNPNSVPRSTVASANGLEMPSRLPTVNIPGESDGTCPICLSDYRSSREMLMALPQCSHRFHTSCITEWSKLNETCPLCRATMASPTSILSLPTSSNASSPSS